jgi:hypothetical protein
VTNTARRTDDGEHLAELPEEPCHGRQTQEALDALSTGLTA